MQFKHNLVTDDVRLRQILKNSRRIAVLGIKTDARLDAPAHSVPRYLQAHGYVILPVPVNQPDATHILGQPCFMKLADIPGGADVVQVFRKPVDIPAHLEDLLAIRPRVVWFQQGIREDAVARTLAEADILVVQDHCMKVDHARLHAAT